MGRWEFLDYHTDENPPKYPIRDWMAKQDRRVIQALEATITTLKGARIWDDPKVLEFRLFKEGQFVGLSELRFSIEDVNPFNPKQKKKIKRRFRIAGIWRPEDHDFILLTGCEKSGYMKIPPDAFEQAMAMKIAYERDGRGDVDEHY